MKNSTVEMTSKNSFPYIFLQTTTSMTRTNGVNGGCWLQMCAVKRISAIVWAAYGTKIQSYFERIEIGSHARASTHRKKTCRTPFFAFDYIFVPNILHFGHWDVNFGANMHSPWSIWSHSEFQQREYARARKLVDTSHAYKMSNASLPTRSLQFISM